MKMGESRVVENPPQEISALIETLLATEQRLVELTAGEVDSVTGRDGRTLVLRRAQEQLHRSEVGKQAAILNALPAHIALLDAQGVIISVNKAWQRFADGNALHGPGHRVGLNYLAICDRAEGDCSSQARLVAQGIRAVLNGQEKSFSIEYPCHSSKEERWFQLTITPLAEDHSNGVVVMHLDITERKRSEALLMESRQRLSLATESAHAGIWEWDVVTNDLVWDAQMYVLYGIKKEDFSGAYDAWQNGLHPDDRERCATEIWAAVERGHGFHSEFRVILPNGEVRDIEAHGKVQRATDGSAPRMIGVNWDITARKQVEHKMTEQANLLNLAHDAIMVRDMDDRIQFWNHGAELVYGWTAEEACGRLSGDFLYQETEAAILSARRTFNLTGVWTGECRHLTKGGDTVIVRSRWTLVRDEHGQPKSKLVINTDVTEQKKIEEQFLRAQRLESIGTLASGVAHDLNNILVPIMMAAPVLRGDMAPVEREKFLDIVETSAQRGADIIKQMLTFARGADGDRILLQPIYLLEEVSKIARQTFPKSIAVRTCYEENIRSLEADSTQLHQVMLNLSINARDAMPNGGELRLSVDNFDVDEYYASMTPGATVGPHVMLQVTDTGSGIPQKIIDKIYDPFFTTKTIGHGTGLGLSTVAGIVKSHGGFMHVDSKPGQTSFKVFLPAKEAVGISDSLQIETIIPRGNGETVLLVDDEHNIREVAELILKDHGYNVLIAEDVPTALAVFARQIGSIAVVITDLAMPGADGLMLVRTLRRIEPELKIIISTGGGDDSNAAEITALNVNAWLTKPYARRNLLLKISHVLQSEIQDAA